MPPTRPQPASPDARDLPVGIFTANARGELDWVNPAFCEIVGLTEEEALGEGWLSKVLDEDKSLVTEEWRCCIKGQRPFRLEFRLARGQRVLGRASQNRGDSGEPRGVTGSLIALTETPDFEQRLRKIVETTSRTTRDEYFEKLTSELAGAVEVEFCLVCEVIEVNGERRLRSRAAWSGNQLDRSVEYPVAGSPCEQALERGVVFIPNRVKQRFPDSRVLDAFPVESYVGVALRDGSGAPIGALAMLGRKAMVDSTHIVDLLKMFSSRASAELKRIRAEEATLESESRYRALFVDSPVAIWEKDFSAAVALVHELEARGVTDLAAHLASDARDATEAFNRIRVLNVNRAAAVLHGIDDVEPLQSHCCIAVPGVNITLLAETLSALARGETSFEAEAPLKTLGGAVIDVAVRLTVVPSEAPGLQRVLVSMIDITQAKRAEGERRELEAKIQQAQKLESLGLLAGGIAHDFNNLLVGVLGNARLMLDELSEGSPERAMAQEIHQAARHASDLASQMLAFSGRGKFTAEHVELAALVRETTPLLEASQQKSARLRLELEPVTVHADPSRLRQVLMNLVTNARDAIGEEPGEIRVSVRSADCSSDDLRGARFNEELPAGRYAVLEVSDNGCGMSAATQRRIFEPFFTTKFTGRGLGMAAVQGIVLSLQGTILMESTLGAGSTFRVLFPTSQGAPARRSAPAAVQPAGPLGGGTILVIDDEAPVRTLTGRILTRQGFDVVLAANGREGVDLFRRHAGSTRAVVLDMTMPELNGAQTSRLLREIDPEVPILLSSGYEQAEAQGAFDLASGFLQKPYEPAQLLDRLREVLR